MSNFHDQDLLDSIFEQMRSLRNVPKYHMKIPKNAKAVLNTARRKALYRTDEELIRNWFSIPYDENMMAYRCRLVSRNDEEKNP